MKKFTDFLKSKGFYIALGTGIVAFAALMIMYNYKSTKENLLNKQAIDLNQPVDKDDQIDGNAVKETQPDDNSKNVAEKAETTQDKSAPVNSDSAIPDTGKNSKKEAENIATVTDSTVETADEVAVISDGTTAKTSQGIDIVASLNYDGEQSLVWPLVGDVILPYSMDTTVYFKTLDTYKCNPGMLIAANEGSTVFSAYEGVVSAIEETKEYGTVVKINLGNEYEAIYGQLMNVSVAVGNTVTIAQPIAEVAPVSRYYSEEGTNLYFGIEKSGEPINPMALFQ